MRTYPHIDFDRLFGFGVGRPNDLIFKRLGIEKPESIASSLLEVKVDRKKLLPQSYRSELIQILNRAVVEYSSQNIAPKVSDGGTIRNYAQNQNRLAAYIELDEIKVVALVSSSYEWPNRFVERNVIRAWFHIVTDLQRQPDITEHQRGVNV